MTATTVIVRFWAILLSVLHNAVEVVESRPWVVINALISFELVLLLC